MNTAAKNAGMASAMSSHLTSFREAAIMQPTITSTPAVAADGTAETTGARNADKASRSPQPRRSGRFGRLRRCRRKTRLGGGVRGAADGADGGGDGVGEQGLVHLGGEAVAVLQSLLVLGGEDAGAAAGADESAQGVERIGHGEGEDGHDDQRQLGRIREQCREALGGEDRAEGLRQLGEGLADGLRVGPGGHAERDADTVVMAMASSMPPLTFITVNTMASTRPIREDPQHLVVKVGQTWVAATAPPLAAAFGSRE